MMIAATIQILAAGSILLAQTCAGLIELAPGNRTDLHLFGEARATLAVHACETAGAAPELRVRLYQMTAALAAPYGPPVPVTGAGVDLAVDLDLPAVTRTTGFELRCFCRDPDQDRWRIVDRVGLTVYPEDLLEPLRAAARRSPLVIHDRSQRLQTFLTDQDITFAAVGRRTGERHTVAIWVVSPTDKPSIETRLRENTEALLVMKDEAGLLPLVVVSDEGDARRVEARVDVLDAMLNDPRAQLTFLELVALATGGPESEVQP